MTKNKITYINCELVKNNIINNLTKYIIDNDIESLVLGVSGGIDSALVSALAYEAICNIKILYPERDNVKFISYYMPIVSNKDDEEYRADDIGKEFITSLPNGKYVKNDIPNKNYDGFLEEDFPNTDYSKKIAQGNIKARLRMIELYNTAYCNNGMVLGTDNLTEYYLGFWTINGDTGDYGMIQNLWKTEVYELAKFMALEYSTNYFNVIDNKGLNKAVALINCVNAVPTDGLGITDSDLDQIGAESYEEVDELLQAWFNRNLEDEDKAEYIDLYNHPVIQRHIKSEFKRKYL